MSAFSRFKFNVLRIKSKRFIFSSPRKDDAEYTRTLLLYAFNSLLNILHRWQLAFQLFRQAAGDLVGADADGLAHVLEGVFRHKIVLALAKQQANRRIVLFFLQNAIN